MDYYYIKGGKKLSGELSVYSAKNALLPILAGSIVCKDNVVIKNCCKFSDVMYMIKMLKSLGAKASFKGNDLYLNLKNVKIYEVPEEHTKKVRSSIFMLGSLLSRFKRAKVAYPGGCNIGTRPIDLHLMGLKSLNVKIEEKDGFIICDGKDMQPGVVKFAFPSVGATENIMMASIFLNGKTTIINAAKEPEIVDLQNFLNSMGAKIKGAGTNKIVITGVKDIKGIEYKPIPDRIVTGTYLIAGAITKSNITLKNVIPAHNAALIKKLKTAGCKFKIGSDYITMTSPKELKSIKKIVTAPYPGFPTDLQNQLLTLQTVSSGVSKITENLYETRFKISSELIKMGANITIKDRVAEVVGVDELHGKSVNSPDLRSGASLVLAGLVATGETKVYDIENIERGYLNFDQDLKSLNADIERISEVE